MCDALHRFSLAVGVRLTKLSIRMLGFSKTIRLLDRISSQRRAVESPKEARSLAAAVNSVSGSPYYATCLDQSVFLWFLMRRRGLEGALRIGVGFDSGALEGHAWVEYLGTVVNDNADIANQFAVFDEDPTGLVFP